jgi:hypothetical protein
MDERGANIDLLFRNGLKDYEVLPPQDVWDKIQPAAVKKARPFIYLRAAAIVAAVTSISLIAYMLNRDISPDGADLDSFSISEAAPLRVRPLQSLVTPVNDLKEYNIVTVAEIPVVSPVEKGAETRYEKYRVIDDQAGSEIFEGNTARQATKLITTEKAKTNSNAIELTSEVPEFYPELKPVETNRWSIAAMASPTYYSGFGSGKSETSYANSEKSVFSYSGGFAVSYKINKRLSVQTGVYYASHGQRIDGISAFGGFGKYFDTKGSSNFEVMTSSGTVHTNNPDVFLVDNALGNRIITAYTNDVFDPNKANLSYIGGAIIQNFNYLQMPVMLRYKIIDKNLDVNLIGGISSDFLLNNNVFARTAGGKYDLGKTEGMNSLAFSSSLGMGMEYSLSKKISLNLEPTFRYFLNPTKIVSVSGMHPYSFGIFSGISYRF